MSFISLAFAVALAAQGAPAGAAPDIDAKPTITLGDGKLKIDRLHPYYNAWRASARKGGQVRSSSIWNEIMGEITLNGRKAFWWNSGDTTYQGPDLSLMTVFSNLVIVDAETLAPIRGWHHFAPGDIVRYTFDGVHVVIENAKTDDGPRQTTRFDTPAPAYHLEGGYFAVVVPLLDLRVGNSGVIAGVGDKDTPVKGYPFHVVRKEKIKAGAYGLVETTVVKLYEPRTEEWFTFWVIDKAPYVMRFAIKGKDVDQSFDEIGTTAPPDWSFTTEPN